MVLSTEWSQVEIIDLTNEGNGFGFMLVGGRSTGVVIKALIPGGIAERDGRLQNGDHVLQIGERHLRGFNSEQVANVLRQSGHHCRLIVARPVEPSSFDYQSLVSHAPIVPTKLLSDPEGLERQLLENAFYSDSYLSNSTTDLNNPQEMLENGCGSEMSTVDIENSDKFDVKSLASPCSLTVPMLNSYCDPETETYEVELRKNVYGLGITVAGYVCEEEDLSGIFVKSIIEGSAAELSGMIQINDRIVAVDNKSLTGVTNHQAVEILRNTDICVKLTLERFLRGRKYEHLQVALTETKSNVPRSSLPPSPSITTLSWIPGKSDADSVANDNDNEDYVQYQVEAEMASSTTMGSNVFGDGEESMNGIDKTDSISCCSKDHIGINIDEDEDDEDNTTPTTTRTPPRRHSNDSIIAQWKDECPDSTIVVATIRKISGLGISLEATVDVEDGIEKHPHHYIRSILEESPVDSEGSLKPGDELLQVNEHRLKGMKHTEVVKTLKLLPASVKIVCARGPSAPSVINTSQNAEAFDARSILQGGHLSLQALLPKAQSESSLYTSSTATLTEQQRSKSVEQVSGLALWSSDEIFINIEKTDRGFGFSILDYQDPMDSEGTVIVIRGLIPNGSAEATNQIFPGDRLVSVDGQSLHGLTLDEAVNILKSMPPGVVKIGLCRPLSLSDSNMASPEDDNASTT